MSLAVILSDMKDEVRRGTGLETTDQANHFITDAEIYDQLNYELALTYGKLVAARGAKRSAVTAVRATTANIAAIGLDALFLELTSVRRQDGSIWVPLDRAMDADLDRVYGRESGLPVAYQAEGENIILYPTPDTIYNIEIRYVPTFVRLTAGQSFDGVIGFEQRAVWAVIAYCHNKDDDPERAAFARGKVGEIDKQIDELAEERDAGQPARVQVSKPYRWQRGYMRLPGGR